jgi:DNA-binding NarL/FixJ family response regulator
VTVTEMRLAAKLAEPLPVRAYAGFRAGRELSARELEVLTLCARGLKRGEIADVLVTSKETVKSHVVHILAKLEARNTPHAVTRAYELGYLPILFACDSGGA